MKRLLLVDDDPDLVMLVGDLLEEQGYLVERALDGQQALRLMELSLPDLLVCDIMMPGLDGYALVQQVRTNPHYARLPVIFLSARGEVTDRARGLKSGADAYVVKPFEPEELLATVEALLGGAERLMQLSGPPRPAPALAPTDCGVALTPSEQRVLPYVARGHSNKEIARLLTLSPRTIERHITNLLIKTRLSNRTELALWAMRNGRA